VYDYKIYEYLAQQIVDLYEPIQTHYIELMAEHLKDIGKLTTTDVHRLEQIQRMRGNSREIAEELSIVSKKTIKYIEKMFLQIAEDDYSFSEKYYSAKGLNQIPFSQNTALKRIVAAEADRTSGLLINLSQTTASQLKKNPLNYRQAIDTAVRASSSGISDYNTAIRRVLRKASSEGINFVDFDSGYRRRLDSQVRMNVLEGIKQTNIGVARQLGKEFGADGVEISVHGLCAPDHLDIQGYQFTNKEFDKLQESLDRPIGTLNCKHFVFPILLGISTSAHSEKELADFKRLSTERVEIGGKEKTRYEWSQEQRKLETAVRKQKDIAVAAKKSEDMLLRRESQAKINAYKTQYNQIAKSAGLESYKERMTVSEFRPVKPLTNAVGEPIIIVKKTTIIGKPNSITQRTSSQGGIERNYYGNNGKQEKQIANNNHNRPKYHPFGKHGEHAHDYIYDKDGILIDRSTRELNDRERKENTDIL